MDSPSGPLFPEITINTFHNSPPCLHPVRGGKCKTCVCTAQVITVSFAERAPRYLQMKPRAPGWPSPIDPLHTHSKDVHQRLWVTEKEASGAGRCSWGLTGNSRISTGTLVHSSVVCFQLCFENHNFFHVCLWGTEFLESENEHSFSFSSF